MKAIKQLFELIIKTIYPKKCICCGEIIDESASLCKDCEKSIEKIEADNICLECGLEKESCVCKYNIFRFNGSISVFKNEGIAQKAYYSYKFAKRQHYYVFFANEMATAILKCYKDINFDFVCYVPSYKKHGYNHSGYIANAVAKRLNVQFCGNLLSCVKRCKKQHKSTIKERINNVDGKYLANFCLNGKNVLLIDDIKTTGATLDECSKELLFAGANSVYCATVLGSSAIKK